MAGNKFWGGGDESSSESDSDSDSDGVPAVPAAQQAKSQYKARWAEESSSEEEDTQRRVVKSHTDKRYDQMRERLKLLKNHMKIDDYQSLITDYEALFKTLEKLPKTLVEQEGIPGMFIKAITDMEQYTEKEHARLQEEKNKGIKPSENRQRAFNTLRAKVRKGNKTYEEDVKRCKENSKDFESDDDAENDEDSNSSEEDDAASSSGDSSSSSDDSSSSDSDSDSDDSSSSSGSSSSSDDSEGESWSSGSEDSEMGGDEEAVREKKMLRWLITDEKKEKEAKKLEKEKADAATKKKKEERNREERTPKAMGKKDKSEHTEKRKGADEPEEYSPEELMKKVTDIAQQRGKRNFDRSTYIDKLKALLPHAEKQGPRAELYIYCQMTSADLDNAGGAFAPMRLDMWNQAFDKVMGMLPILIAAYNDDSNKSIDSDQEDPRSYPKNQDLYVSFVEKLDDELYKALQFTMDVYGAEYQEILGNYSKFLVLLRKVIKFFEDTKQTQQLGILSMRLIEQLHYKPDALNAHVFAAIQHTMPEEEKSEWVWPEDSTLFMAKLVGYVYATIGQDALLKRASFCQVYHLALHDKWAHARDLLHLGSLTEKAEGSDVRTQILHNRVVAQMGLCAFRLGRIQDAHQSLAAVCGHNKARELLAQGLSYSKNMDRTPEQERAERLRQLPYHMHINLEVLECAHHICAMLLEVPNMAMQTIDPTAKSKIISRVLRRALETYDKQQFIGPPENSKEAVVAAAKALQRGDWQNACGALEELKLWEHIDTGNPKAGEKVREMIRQNVKTEALRTYLFAYASIYDSFHLNQLVGMFDLEPKVVHSIISKMIINEEITAFWDESSKYVLMQHSEPTPLQRLALALADKGAQAMETNESLNNQKSGKLGGQQQQGQGGRWDQGASNQRRGGFKGGNNRDDKGGKGKGRGKSSMGNARPAQMRGWENARPLALRGMGASAQRGWSTRPA